MEKKKDSFFEKMATNITCWTGSSPAFGIAFAVIVILIWFARIVIAKN